MDEDHRKQAVLALSNVNEIIHPPSLLCSTVSLGRQSVLFTLDIRGAVIVVFSDHTVTMHEAAMVVNISQCHATISIPPSVLITPPPLAGALRELFTSRLNMDKFCVNLF